jgi:GntR family transcriptional regulator
MPPPSAYQRVAHELRERITSGAYPPASKLPSLREVEEEFSVSRYISRTAMQVLIAEGRIEGRFGGGYYVRAFQPIIRDGIGRLVKADRDAGRSIWETDPGTAGRDLDVIDVTVTREEAPADIACDLDLEAGAPVIVRRRRFILDGKPVSVAQSYYPADIAEGTAIAEQDTRPGGTYARLREQGVEPARFREDVVARMPAPEEAESLQLPPGTPVATVRRVAWAEDGRPVEVAAILCDATSYVFRYQWEGR